MVKERSILELLQFQIARVTFNIAFPGDLFTSDYSGEGIFPHITSTADYKDGSTSEFSPEFIVLFLQELMLENIK